VPGEKYLKGKNAGTTATFEMRQSTITSFGMTHQPKSDPEGSLPLILTPNHIYSCLGISKCTEIRQLKSGSRELPYRATILFCSETFEGTIGVRVLRRAPFLYGRISSHSLQMNTFTCKKTALQS
jgi:hypothetical protein